MTEITTEILKTIDTFGAPIDLHAGPIGISCSGGADSALLLYHLMKHKTDDKIYIFTTGNNHNKRINVKIARRVVEQCIELTGNDNVEHHISYCETQTQEMLFPKLSSYFSNDTVGIVYTGVTENPPEDVLVNFTKEAEADRTSELKRSTYIAGYNNCTFYTPFTNVNKSTIASMYAEDGLLETLFPLTRSCEWDPKNPLYYDVPNPGDGHCGICWWCQERHWGFGKL